MTYWIDISKRPTLTVKDFELFFEMTNHTHSHFVVHYPGPRDRFFERINFILFRRDRLLEDERDRFPEYAEENSQLKNHSHALMKNMAKDFIRRIRK